VSGVMAGRFLRLNHLGERIAINIYGAQILLGRLTAPALGPMLREIRQHERRHLQIFAAEMTARGVPRSKLFVLLGVGGYLLGLVTAAFGPHGIYACTAAVETVVLRHLGHQLCELAKVGDTRAIQAIEAILADEESHRDYGMPPRRSWLHRAVYAAVTPATSGVIQLGMHL
jgi:3-demethoxyubiquinol 3-hydroxylase